MCTTKHTTKYTSVTIVNWGNYQNQGTALGTTNGTSTGHQRDTNNNYNNYNK